MGTSTDAHLYFGFDIYSEDDSCDDQDFYDNFVSRIEEDWAEIWADKLGLKDESGFFKDNEYAFEAGTPEYIEADKKWHDFRDKVRKIKDESIIDIDIHCYIDCPTYFVCLKRSHSYASRGYPSEVDPSLLTSITDEEIQEMKEFCEFLGIPWQEPKWYIASYWG